MTNSPWSQRISLWYFRRPTIGYGLLFAVTALVGVLPRSEPAIAFSVVMLPWLVLAVAILNLPFIGAALRGFTFSAPVRRNHALEHGTIHFLVTEHGYRRIAGRASRKGFRISGVRDPDQIQAAFSRLMELDRDEWQSVVVAASCGSSIVVAQGLATILLLATLAGFVIWQPSRVVVGVALTVQLLLWVFLRAPVGRWLQWNRLLAADFESAKIRSIKKVSATWPFDRSPAYFVRTAIK